MRALFSALFEGHFQPFALFGALFESLLRKILHNLVRYLRVKATEQAHLLKCPCFA